MSKKKVVITGLGVLAPNGNNIHEFWESLCQGKSGINAITYFDTEGFSVKIAGELNGFKVEEHLETSQIRKLDPFSIFALVAAQEAIENAKINWNNINMHQVGVILGTGVGGIYTMEEQHSVLMNRGSRRISPFFVPKMIANIAAGHVAIKWGLKGPNHTVTTACASATDAIGIATRLIQIGDADMIIAGGTEASITPLTISGFANMKALSRNPDNQTASRPFDKNRNGFVMGEGAGIMVIESEEHAKNRHAEILGEIAGYGSTNDASHITQPQKEGAVLAMKKAIQDAGLLPVNIDYINAHGTSTPLNDKNETNAIKDVFGDHAYSLKISSTKSMTGHLLGASGSIEAIASVKAIEHNLAPPTINYVTADPDCDLDYVPNTVQQFPIDTVISNSFGFGGHNAVILIKRWKS
ncbi:MAG TPA: beta-ketoacyl-[acyl-carrier-protein] synthase II [Candidatus Marinimicrobia bacterium]|nr:beta-ketoacyl-[acyl-carrier-protein] synthase II [Candidatus Neomarinimicrobiota bacterium]